MNELKKNIAGMAGFEKDVEGVKGVYVTSSSNEDVENERENNRENGAENEEEEGKEDQKLLNSEQTEQTNSNDQTTTSTNAEQSIDYEEVEGKLTTSKEKIRK